MGIQITVLGSGSGGNCTLIEPGKTALLVDTGLSCRQVTQRLAGEIATEQLRHLVRAHLSRDCNRPELAHKVVKDNPHQIGATHVQANLSHQDQPTARLRV